MNDMSIMQSALFIGTSVAGITTVALFFDKRASTWLLCLPWLTILLAASWFILTKGYYSRSDVQLGVPIRIDLVLFPPLILFCCVAGAIRIYIRKQSKKEKK